MYDSKLNFKAYILYLTNRFQKSLNLKIIAHKDWGADQKTLVTLYRTAIEGLRERTEHLDIFLFLPITQWCSISDDLFTG